MIPIGFDWTGKHIFVCTAPIAPKVAAVSARPSVALTIDNEPGAIRSLLIRCVADLEIVRRPSDGVPSGVDEIDG